MENDYCPIYVVVLIVSSLASILNFMRDDLNVICKFMIYSIILTFTILLSLVYQLHNNQGYFVALGALIGYGIGFYASKKMRHEEQSKCMFCVQFNDGIISYLFFH